MPMWWSDPHPAGHQQAPHHQAGSGPDPPAPVHYRPRVAGSHDGDRDAGRGRRCDSCCRPSAFGALIAANQIRTRRWCQVRCSLSLPAPLALVAGVGRHHGLVWVASQTGGCWSSRRVYSLSSSVSQASAALSRAAISCDFPSCAEIIATNEANIATRQRVRQTMDSVDNENTRWTASTNDTPPSAGPAARAAAIALLIMPTLANRTLRGRTWRAKVSIFSRCALIRCGSSPRFFPLSFIALSSQTK